VPALVRVGYRVLQVWSRTEASARSLAEPLGIAYTTDLGDVVVDADVYIACVADGALSEVAERVVARAGVAPLFLHTAGSVGMELWQRCGAAHYGILYPLQTFSKEREVNMREVSLFVEASDEDALTEIETLAQGLSDRVYRADSKRRARLHIAAVFACNFANAMYDAAHHLLSEDNIPFEALLPLIDETAAKVHTLAPREAQTGPAVRDDKVVMQRHIEALDGNERLREIYGAVSELIQHYSKSLESSEHSEESENS
jgi:predicted short-subunit dehydrogenase-like oxidoreductase (DUF2520 family)